MSLILKKNDSSVRVLRRKTVSHFVESLGKVFAHKDTYIGSIPLDATELPLGFGKNQPELMPQELAALEAKIFAKARCAKEEAEARQRAHEADPNWRLTEVRSTLSAVVALPSLSAADPDLVKEVWALADALPGRAEPAAHTEDPLAVLIGAIRTATRAVEAPDFMTRDPDVPLADTPAAMAWKTIREVTSSSMPGSLMHALQEKGWVLRRSASEPRAQDTAAVGAGDGEAGGAEAAGHAS